MIALLVLLLVLPMWLVFGGIALGCSGLRPPSSSSRRAAAVPPAQIASRGKNPLRAPIANRRHPIDGALRVVGGTLMIAAGIGAYRALYELAHWFR